MPGLLRVRATLETSWTLLGGLFGFVPFIPRLLRAVVTGRRDRARMLALLRSGLDTPPVDAPPAARIGASRPTTVFIVAGEPSGDLHAADLVRALRRAEPEVRIVALGGPRLLPLGVEFAGDLVSDPVMGVLPVLRRIPRFFRLYRDVLLRFETDPPDVFVGVDYPGLNTRLARAARRRGIATVAYIAPQVWAWAPWRSRALARAYDRIVAILPFEPAVFAAAGGEAAYVGHPLFENLTRRGVDEAVVARLREPLPPGGVLVALLPGSRMSEVVANSALLLDAARRVAMARPDARFVVPLATERLRAAVAARFAELPFDVTLAPPEHSDEAMRAADAALAVSGTATLHLVHHRVPTVVCYRSSQSGLLLARVLLVSPWFALPNLLSGHEALREFLTASDDGTDLAAALLDVLPGGPGRAAALSALDEIARRLDAPGVADRAARWVLASRLR